METRNGMIQFRTEQVEIPTNKPGKVRVIDQVQYRQCFDGIWGKWQPVPQARKD